MAKIQPVRDLENNLIAPVTHERAVYDSEGYTVEQKLSEVKPSDLYGPANYDVHSINIAALQSFAGALLNNGTYGSGEGSHYRLPVTPGDVVNITTGETCRISFLSNVGRPISGNTVPAISSYLMDSQKVYYFHVPEDCVAIAFSHLATDGVTDRSPVSLSVATSKMAKSNDDGSIIPMSAPRYMISGNGDKIVGANISDAISYLFPVKAGHTYYVWPTFSGALRYAQISSLPDNNIEVIAYGNATSTFGDSGMSISVKPETDGYFFICSYKASAAALSIVAKEVTEDNSVGSVKQSVNKVLSLSSGYDEVALDALDERPYAILLDTGLYGTSNTYKHVLVPVAAGQVLKIQGNETNPARIAWLTSDSDPVASTCPAYIPGTRLFVVENGVLTVPDGASYMFVYLGISGQYKPAYVGVYTGESSSESGDKTDILSLNPESEFFPKLISANKRYYTSSTTNSPYPLVIGHISDVHGNWTNVRRFLKFCNHYGSKIKCLINTGDIIPSYLYLDGVKYTGAADYNAIEGIENVLNVIGNHDTASREGSSNWDWQACVGKVAYDEYFAPHIASWGVTQPTNAAANGYCYYYKDFTANNVRLVVTDVMGYDETEDAWLASVLESARDAGLHVVIATHFSSSLPAAEGYDRAFDKFPINYSTTYEVGTNAVNLNAYNKKAYMMMEAVDAFMQAGGIFVGYIQGHYHCDFIARVAKYPNQLIFSIGSSKTGEVRDYMHTIGQRDQDEFQIVAIDTYTKNVKVYKVGANVDRVGRHVNSACVSYETHQVIAEGY